MELDFSVIAFIAAAVVLLLQIVSLVQIAGIKRTIRAQRDNRPQPMQHEDRSGQRNQEFRRHERRPFPDQKQHHPAPAQVDPVEKSLRDINLRLKSAEREQESARRRIQENFQRSDHNRGRDDRERRGRGDRDRNRGHRRDNWQDRNRGGGFQQHHSPSGQQQRNEPPAEKREAAGQDAGTDAPVQNVVTPSVAQNLLNVSDYDADQNLQHGRKIIVKRRTLKDEAPEENSAESTSVEDAPRHAAASDTGAAAPAAFEAGPSPVVHQEEETRIGDAAPDLNQEEGISFGRR